MVTVEVGVEARWTIRRIWVSFCGDSGVRYMSSELERSAGTEDWTSHGPGKEGVVPICSAGYATVEVGGCVFESPCGESGNALSMRRAERRSKRMGGWSSAAQMNGEKRRRGEIGAVKLGPCTQARRWRRSTNLAQAPVAARMSLVAGHSSSSPQYSAGASATQAAASARSSRLVPSNPTRIKHIVTIQNQPRLHPHPPLRRPQHVSIYGAKLGRRSRILVVYRQTHEPNSISPPPIQSRGIQHPKPHPIRESEADYVGRRWGNTCFL
jgi:hypothetical protein